MNLRDMKKDQKEEEVIDSPDEISKDSAVVENTEPAEVATVEIPKEKTPDVVEAVVEKKVEEPPVESKEDIAKKKAEEKLLRSSQRRKAASKPREAAVVKETPAQNLSLAPTSSMPPSNNMFESMNAMLVEMADQNAQLRTMNTEMINEMKKVNSKIIEMLDRPIEPKVVIMQPETTKVITKTITRDANNLIQSITEKVEDVPVDEKEIITKKDK